MNVSQTSSCFLCNHGNVTLGSSQWFTHFVLKIEKLSFCSILLSHFLSTHFAQATKGASKLWHMIPYHTSTTLPQQAFALSFPRVTRPPFLLCSHDISEHFLPLPVPLPKGKSSTKRSLTALTHIHFSIRLSAVELKG
jgi:hypothetical protein